MTKEQAEFLEKAMFEVDQELSIRDHYSGRGMYGQTTCAVVVEDVTTLLTAVLQYMKGNIVDYEDEDHGISMEVWNGEKVPDFSTLRIDNMGMKVVVY